MLEGEGWQRWLHELRRQEFERLLAQIPLGPAARVLELGSGDSFQLDLLRRRFERVTAIDPFRAPPDGRGFVFAPAEHLPFASECFDLVFSSNVFEHLRDRGAALAEAVRVLRPGGYMAHAVPSRVWKVSGLLLNPFCYALHMAGKWSLARRRIPAAGQAQTAGSAPRPTLRGVFDRCFRPPIHGTFPSHYEELRAYGKKPWKRALAHPRLELVAEVPLLAYSPFGVFRSRLAGGRVWLGRHGLSSVHGFVLRRIE
jgi:SAM-dependent methyltransferase